MCARGSAAAAVQECSEWSGAAAVSRASAPGRCGRLPGAGDPRLLRLRPNPSPMGARIVALMPQCPYDQNMPEIQLASSRRGTGSPLVVIRQLDREGWAPVIDLLAQEREVVAVDLPGFGDSPPLPDTRPTVQALATEVALWFSTVGLTRPPVVGNSLGGAVALNSPGPWRGSRQRRIRPVPHRPVDRPRGRLRPRLAPLRAHHGADPRPPHGTPDQKPAGSNTRLLATRRASLADDGRSGRRCPAQPGPLTRLRSHTPGRPHLPAHRLHPQRPGHGRLGQHEIF
ncbi:hypothetical protein SGLAM104S_00018 [Streptomyces glaucescens]